MKVKTVFTCSSCGHSASKWEGKCAACGEWNTYQEENQVKSAPVNNHRELYKNEVVARPIPIQTIKSSDNPRIIIVDKELNRCLGGGLVPGSISLIGGEPGIGKSTLLLQLALNLPLDILYVSGEESPQQIKLRADRIGIKNPNCNILSETELNKILKIAKEEQPQIIIIDSIQTINSQYLESAAGSVSQVRECTSALQIFSKETNIPVIIIGHITKEGSIAGPKILEHIVDTVLQFEGDRNHIYRILRTKKNRFGSTDELGIYEMKAEGLVEVENPSKLLLSQSDENLSGSTIACTIEGMRPLLVETQALVSQSIFGTPQRSSTGFDGRRLSMLLAILEKRAGLFFGQNDVFLNIAGGLKVQDPAIDLAIVSSLVSSLHNVPVTANCCFAGELGLTGEIRAVNRIEQRIEEASRLGMEQMFISAYNYKSIDHSKAPLELVPLKKIEDLITKLFE